MNLRTFLFFGFKMQLDIERIGGFPAEIKPDPAGLEVMMAIIAGIAPLKQPCLIRSGDAPAGIGDD